MNAKNKKSGTFNKDILDLSKKQELSIVNDISEMTDEEYDLLIKKIRESTETIKIEHYSSNAAIDRVQSRSFIDILLAKLAQISSLHKAKIDQKRYVI